MGKAAVVLLRALAVLVGLGTLSSVSSAQEFASQHVGATSEGTRLSLRQPEPETEWFRLPLAMAYAVPAFVSGALLASGGGERAELAVILLSVGLVAEAAVHLAYGDTRGALGSSAALVLFVLVGTVVGAPLGAALCHYDECIDETLVGMAAGAIGGFALWGILDTAFFAHTTVDKPYSTSARITPFLAPLFDGPVRSDAPHLAGAVLGSSVRL